MSSFSFASSAVCMNEARSEQELTTQWRAAMSDFPTGVTIVTTADNGRPSGSTVSAFCSLSLRPRLLLVCLDVRSQTLASIRQSNAFAVNILADEARAMALKFGTKGGDKFSGIDYRLGVSGCPLLPDCCASIECRLSACHVEGDHAILIGEPRHLTREPARRPLRYHRGEFGA